MGPKRPRMTLSYGDFEVLDQQHIEQLRVQSAPKPVVGDDNQPILNEARAKVLHSLEQFCGGPYRIPSRGSRMN